jgi:RNA polymerase sigma-70 factor (ECF subfamily)
VTTDEVLLEQWRAGRAQSGNELFNRHYAALERFFRNKCELAFEDLVQRTFMECIAHRDQFRGESTFRTFLFGVARNVLREHLRRISGPRGQIDFGVTSIEDLGQSITSLLQRQAEHARLLKCLRELSIDDQITLELYYWEDLSAKDLAEIFFQMEGARMSESGVRNRIRRAKERLVGRLDAASHKSIESEDAFEKIDVWAREVRKALFGDATNFQPHREEKLDS